MSKKALSTDELNDLLQKDSSTESADDLERKMEMVLEFPVEISVRLGHTYMPIEDIMDLTTGRVIDLNRQISEPVDVLVNGKPFAKAEVISMGEYFGIRITYIIKQEERIERLK